MKQLRELFSGLSNTEESEIRRSTTSSGTLKRARDEVCPPDEAKQKKQPKPINPPIFDEILKTHNIFNFELTRDLITRHACSHPEHVYIADDSNTFQGLTMLHLAVDERLFDTAKQLIEKGADVNAAITGNGPNLGKTALSMAAFRNETEIARLLIENGADVNPI